MGPGAARQGTRGRCGGAAGGSAALRRRPEQAKGRATVNAFSRAAECRLQVRERARECWVAAASSSVAVVLTGGRNARECDAGPKAAKPAAMPAQARKRRVRKKPAGARPVCRSAACAAVLAAAGFFEGRRQLRSLGCRRLPAPGLAFALTPLRRTCSSGCAAAAAQGCAAGGGREHRQLRGGG